MNSPQSTNLRRDEESRFTHNKDDRLIIRLTNGEDKLKCRQEWMCQQELERQRERLKQQMILNYGRKHAEITKHNQTSSHRSRSTSSNTLPLYFRHKEKSMSSAAFKSDIVSKKLDGSASGAVPLFKGPEGAQFNIKDLRQIEVNIRRNILVKGPVTELQRDILDPEDVILERREGEGRRPIFDRDEIKKAVSEVKKQHTLVATNSEQSGKLRIFKRCSSSLSLNRSRSYSPGYPSHIRSRNAESKHHRRVEYNYCHKSDRHDNTDNKEHKEKYIGRDIRRHNNNHSYSEERNASSSHSRSIIENRSYCNRYRDRYRNRSNERSQEKGDRDKDRDRNRCTERDRNRNRDSFRNRKDTAPHCVKPVPMDIYYGTLPPRPLLMSPMVPIPRGQFPLLRGRRHPSLMAPVRSFPPQFIPPDVYRMELPVPNIKYKPMF
ncbi:PREDICTED: RNA-binding protein 25-like [Dinoponera quadriceps]|uniref:RNA-binding protein 25-like n=1 Tax=Dinoponera quadriceps TaxID=609295 RepID=A0A6P3Y0D7_DINQU|nr:PREDICTED: RNA-binding protein 25-like [Dinoponera quadriceps]